MMKKKEVEADDSLLPQEIIRDILTRLPVKSLIRFQCVCRHWRDLFKDPSFIADHLRHSNRQNPYILFQLGSWHSGLYSLGSDMQVCTFQKPPLIEHMDRGTIVGSSNGLLCVKTYRLQHSFLLWNPAIKEVKKVPKIDFCRRYYRRGTYSIGFGFCPSLNDYKIVITFVKNDYFEMFKVYSLRSNSWKEVKYGLDACKIYHGVTVNGVMFWWGKKSTRKDHCLYFEVVIFSFDLATEKWTVIPEPEQHSSTVYHNLMVYEGKLAFVICTDDSKHSAIHLLVKEEVVGASRETWNWTKIFTSNPYPSNGLLPQTMWGNEILCRSKNSESTITVLFNPTTEKFKKLDMCNIGAVQEIFNYVESLVSVGGTKALTKFLKRQGSPSQGSPRRLRRILS